VRRALLERLLSDVISPLRLVCGGGLTWQGASGDELRVLLVRDREESSCTDRDRKRVVRWLGSEPSIVEYRVGPLRPTEGDPAGSTDRVPRPRALGRTPMERAARFREEALVAYREAAAILGRPETVLAAEKLVRSAALADAALREVTLPLLRRLGLLKGSPAGRDLGSELCSFLDLDLHERIRRTRDGLRRRGEPRTPLEEALWMVARLEDCECGVIQIPDLHDFERKLVWGTRVVVNGVGELLEAGPGSELGKRLAEAAARRRTHASRERARRTQKPRWPQTREVLFMAASSAKVEAVVGEDHVARTLLPTALAKACGAEVLPAEVPAQIPWRNAEGGVDWIRSRWVAAHPALVWVSVPKTQWKAPVLAAVVPTARCPVPILGDDWFDDAVVRRHERKEQVQ
jgi:hypothetical protein